jgi:hypothetical protein
MDILFNPFTILTVSLVGLPVALLRYSIKAIHGLGVGGCLSQLGRIGRVFGIIVGLVFVLIATFRDLIAASDSPTQDDDTMGDVFRGGDLNFRTGKFDDGTDPAGWYEND